MIHIVDYNTGNVGSIVNLIKKNGSVGIVVKSPEELSDASKIILPGVGHFDFGMDQLRKSGWINILNKKVLIEKVPVLGICLGMHLMCSFSEEGEGPGLGWVDAEVKKFVFDSPEIKVPHMGWNFVHPVHKNTLFRNFTETPRFYFVHSYYVKCNQEVNILGNTIYHSQKIVSSFQKENIFGVQFHPEKSHVFGLQLIKNFIHL